MSPFFSPYWAENSRQGLSSAPMAWKQGQLVLKCLPLEGTLTPRSLPEKRNLNGSDLSRFRSTKDRIASSKFRGKVIRHTTLFLQQVKFKKRKEKRERNIKRLKGKSAITRHLQIYQPVAMPAPYLDPDWKN